MLVFPKGFFPKTIILGYLYQIFGGGVGDASFVGGFDSVVGSFWVAKVKVLRQEIISKISTLIETSEDMKLGVATHFLFEMILDLDLLV